MVRYLGPKLKIIRRLNYPVLIGFCNKNILKKKMLKDNKNILLKKKNISEFKENIKTRKKIQYIYGITNYKLRKYIKKKKNYRINNKIDFDLLLLIEQRLDINLFKIGITRTIAQARQWILHKYFIINNCKYGVISYLVQKGDIIFIKKNNLSILLCIKQNIKERIEKCVLKKYLFSSFFKICFLKLNIKITKKINIRELILK